MRPDPKYTSTVYFGVTLYRDDLQDLFTLLERDNRELYIRAVDAAFDSSDDFFKHVVARKIHGLRITQSHNSVNVDIGYSVRLFASVGDAMHQKYFQDISQFIRDRQARYLFGLSNVYTTPAAAALLGMCAVRLAVLVANTYAGTPHSFLADYLSALVPGLLCLALVPPAAIYPNGSAKSDTLARTIRQVLVTVFSGLAVLLIAKYIFGIG